jgi:CheY-like chemotaxis protein
MPTLLEHALRVLVVDDSADTVNSLSVLLGLWGHEYRGVMDGPSALTVAEEFRPDVALLDISIELRG